MSDSARWCETCQRWGDHHTDRHVPACALAGHASPVEGRHKLTVTAGPDGPEFEIGVCDDHYASVASGITTGLSFSGRQ